MTKQLDDNLERWWIQFLRGWTHHPEQEPVEVPDELQHPNCELEVQVLVYYYKLTDSAQVNTRLKQLPKINYSIVFDMP